MENKLNRVGAAWEKPNCISIKLTEMVSEDIRLVMLRNQYKTSQKHPDFVVFCSNEVEAEASAHSGTKKFE